MPGLLVGITPEVKVLLASVLVGLAVLMVAYTFLAGLGAPRKFSLRGDSFEDRRRETLRQGSGMYRMLEPLIDLLAKWNQDRGKAFQERLARELKAAGTRLPWFPAEYIALRQLEGVLVGAMVVFGLSLSSGNVLGALLVGAAVGWVYPFIGLRDVGRRARARLAKMKERLPYAVDLMALMMEAGAGFTESLETAVAESRENPVGEEFGEVLRDTEMGRTRKEAMLALQDRLQDKDISELVFAIVKGEEMGTPLAQILRNQADQMRLKRSQAAEREAAEAQVAIMFPGFLVMVACILIITAPFVLELLSQKSGLSDLF